MLQRRNVTAKRVAPLVVVQLFLFCALPALGRDCPEKCVPNAGVECFVESGTCLLVQGRARAAIELLKSGKKRFPRETKIYELLAAAYLEDSNLFWAEKTLRSALDMDGSSWGARNLLAWVLLKQGDLDAAEDVLEHVEAEPEGPEKARRALLLALVLKTRGKDWEDEYLQAWASQSIFPEDALMLRALRSSWMPGYIQPLTLRLDLQSGYTTNSQAGSPTDPGSPGGGSGLGRLNLSARFVWPASRWMRPAVELGFKGHGIVDDAYQDYSYMDPSVRAGIFLFPGFPRLFIGYNGDLLVMARPKGRGRYFYEGHRLELELDTGSTLFFLGGGRRIFEESGRTRWEFDGGAGRAVSSQGVKFMAAFLLRYHDTAGDVYDLVGGTLLTMASVRLFMDSYLRLGLTLGTDYYLLSGASRGEAAFGVSQKRKDMSTKVSLGLWSPLFFGTRVGITYELSYRDSTADSEDRDYGFLENRMMVGIKFSAGTDPFEPDVEARTYHGMIDWGVSRGGSFEEEERIQELLRQDEAARRGSSCVE